MPLIQQWLREHKVEYISRDNKQVLVVSLTACMHAGLDAHARCQRLNAW